MLHATKLKLSTQRIFIFLIFKITSISIICPAACMVNNSYIYNLDVLYAMDEMFTSNYYSAETNLDQTTSFDIVL